MTTITIEITDEQAKLWQEEAQRMNMSLERFTAQSVQDRVEGRKQYVSTAIHRIIKENQELYRRLS